jgi:NADH:ubiquinone oxidoreductase subunit E
MQNKSSNGENRKIEKKKKKNKKKTKKKKKKKKKKKRRPAIFQVLKEAFKLRSFNSKRKKSDEKDFCF